MSSIFVHGTGCVSPAGWDVSSFRNAIDASQPLPSKEMLRPGWEHPVRVRQVPPPQPRPAFLANARLRRTSPVSHYATAAALAALGNDAEKIRTGELKLGIILTVMSGCVNYSRRFYDETLRDPSTASPLVFPETVFNAPSSHIAALLGAEAVNYTMVGDPGTFLQGLALAADWLGAGRVDGCLVIASEEADWMTADAFRLFHKRIIVSDGAGAIYLRRDPTIGQSVRLRAITDSHLFLASQTRHCAAEKMKSQLNNRTDQTGVLLCDGLQDLPRFDAAEADAWNAWRGPRISIKKVLGEGLIAAAAWQCVAAIDALQRAHCGVANVSVVGCNQQAIGAQFEV